jgi:hypothetical protein
MTNVTHKFFSMCLFIFITLYAAQILFYVFIYIYNSLHVSSTQCSSSGETNCINTASGNSHSVLVAEVCTGWKKTSSSKKFQKFYDCHPVVLTFDTITGYVQTQPLFQLSSYVFRSYVRIIKFRIETFYILCLYQARGRSVCKIETCALVIEAK